MHVDHPAFIKPDNPSSVLLRYINFTKLMSMFDTGSLFFCRADKLKETDPFEETLPLKELESFQKQTRLKPENIRSAYKTHSRETFVNCWHLNDSESMAMWKIYSRSDSGIAIQTTFEALTNCFNVFPEPIYIGVIQYVDFVVDTFYAQNNKGYPGANTFVPFIHKRAIYRDEHEVRAIYTKSGSEPLTGVRVSVDLRVLVHKIVLSPNSPTWYEEVVRNSVKRTSLGIEVVRSSSDSSPYS